MNKRKKGFTVLELLIVLVLISVLVAIIAPAMSKAKAKSMIKAKAAVDLANLHTAYVEISMDLMADGSMSEISKKLLPVKCSIDSDAKLWINYSKPVTLEVYFVNGDNFYSIDYLAEIAETGTSELSIEKPFTLGFWYEAGFGKIDEYAPRD